MNMDGADGPKKPDPYRKSAFRRPSRRCTYIIVGVTLLCIILCIVLAVQLSRKSKKDCPEGIHCDWRSMPHTEFLKDTRCGDKMCTTRPCIRAAEFALSRIDSSKDPCEDFYEFACGTYEQESVLFPGESEGVFTYQEMEQELYLSMKEVIDSISGKPGNKGFTLRLTKKIYDDCMNTDHHDDVLTKEIWQKMFADDGMLPWPLVNGHSSTEQRHFVKMMSSSLFYKENPFFDIYGPDEVTEKNRTYWTFRFKETIYLDHLKTIYKSDPEDENSVLYKYLFAVAQILTEVGLDEERVKSVLTNFTKLEAELIAVTTKVMESNEKVYEKNEHLRYEFHNHSCQKLDHDMENMKWCKIVEQLRTDYGLPKKVEIRIELPTLQNYFDAVDDVLGHFLDREVVNYIAVKFIMHNIKYMPSPLRELYYREKDVFFRGFSTRYWPLSTRWQQCVNIIIDIMWLPLEKEYIRQKLDEEKITKIRHMAKRLEKTCTSLIDKMTWLKKLLPGTEFKKMIRDRDLVIGRYDELLLQDDTAIDNYYASASSKSVLTNPSNPLIADVLEMFKLQEKASLSSNKEILSLGGSRWKSSLTMFTSMLIPAKIFLPYPAVTFPMHLPGRPMSVEYATLGAYMFTYMSNTWFMEIGRQNSTFEAFVKSTLKCLREDSHLYKTGKQKFQVQLAEKHTGLTGLPYDDLRLIFEYLSAAGTLGSFESYAEYLEDNDDKGLPGLPFTNKQLFFISNAQIHCEKFSEKGYADFPVYLISPARYRVNVPFANSKAFSDAFRCPSGSPMNPKRKCCIFGDGTHSTECK